MTSRYPRRSQVVKSKPSASYAMSSRAMVTTSAGSYPREMEKLVDGDGRVSLSAEDYAGYTEDEVAAFFASRDYEVSWFTSEDGKVWKVASDFDEGGVVNADRNNISREKAWELIRSDFDNGGSRIVHHHNHPVVLDDDSGIIDIFSPDDITYYSEMAMKYPKDGHNHPYFNVYKVHTKQGDTFTMRYTNPGTSYLSDFSSGYMFAMLDAKSAARRQAKAGKIPYTNRAAAEFVDQYMIDYLKSDGDNYGIEFETNWRKRG